MRPLAEIHSAIRSQPHLDALRLEYADACEAKDPAYARYIRRAVALASGKVSHSIPARDVETRIAHPLMHYCYKVVFGRGFPEEITIDPYVFIDRGHELLDMAPVRRVTFSTRPVPRDLEVPRRAAVVPSPIRELMACPHLDRIYSIDFVETLYQHWYCDLEDLECLVEGRYLGRLLRLSLPPSRIRHVEEGFGLQLWRRALARPEFRKMLTLDMPGYPGEQEKESDDGWTRVTEGSPMPEAGRALEREFGYVPSLHLITTWGTWSGGMHDSEIVLAALRGELPKFPAGAPVTEEMYVLPPPIMTKIGYE